MFGFHRRKKAVDLVLLGGHVYTQNPDMEWAEAVVCGEGEILYVGNNQDAEAMAQSDTTVVNLEGKFVLPGFINLYAHPARRLFDDKILHLNVGQDREAVIETIKEYVNAEGKEGYFGYGFSEEILKDLDSDGRKQLLDEISEDKNLVFLSENGQTLWMNNFAVEQVKLAAEEAGAARISMNFILQALEIFDYEQLQEDTAALGQMYASKGFTAVVDCGSPSFMDEYYQDGLLALFHEDKLQQRHYGSVSVKSDANSSQASNALMYKKVQTTELEGKIFCDIMKIAIDFLRNNAEKIQALKEVVLHGSEKGFKIYLEARSAEALEIAVDTVEYVRNQGAKRNRIIIAAKGNPEDKGSLADEMQRENCSVISGISEDLTYEYSATENVESIEAIVDRYTVDAAIALGIYDRYGTIEEGKRGDLTIFETNPFEMEIAQFQEATACMTVVDGQAVYIKI